VNAVRAGTVEWEIRSGNAERRIRNSGNRERKPERTIGAHTKARSHEEFPTRPKGAIFMASCLRVKRIDGSNENPLVRNFDMQRALPARKGVAARWGNSTRRSKALRFRVTPERFGKVSSRRPHGRRYIRRWESLSFRSRPAQGRPERSLARSCAASWLPGWRRRTASR
jgi:hypothetical protein